MPLPSAVRTVTPMRQRGYRQKQDERNDRLGWVRMSLVVPDDQTASFRHAAAVARADAMHDAVAATKNPASDPVLIEVAASSFARAITQDDLSSIERTVKAIPKKDRDAISTSVDALVNGMMDAQTARDEEYAKAEDAKERKRVGEEMTHAAKAVAWSYTAAALLQEIWLLLPVAKSDET